MSGRTTTNHSVRTKLFSRERRASGRSPARFVAHLRFSDGLGLPLKVRALVDNISVGGMALMTERAVECGMRFNVAVTFPGYEETSDVEVEVISLSRLPTREYVSHCRFLSLAPEVLQTVSRWTDARGTD